MSRSRGPNSRERDPSMNYESANEQLRHPQFNRLNSFSQNSQAEISEIAPSRHSRYSRQSKRSRQSTKHSRHSTQAEMVGSDYAGAASRQSKHSTLGPAASEQARGPSRKSRHSTQAPGSEHDGAPSRKSKHSGQAPVSEQARSVHRRQEIRSLDQLEPHVPSSGEEIDDISRIGASVRPKRPVRSPGGSALPSSSSNEAGELTLKQMVAKENEKYAQQ